MMGVGQLRRNCRHDTAATNKTSNIALTVWFQLVRKRRTYAERRTKGRGVSYGKIGLTTVAVTRDLLFEMPLVL